MDQKTLKLLMDLFLANAKNDETVAKLWETDLAKYGASLVNIATQKGRAEAWKQSAEKIKELLI